MSNHSKLGRIEDLETTVAGVKECLVQHRKEIDAHSSRIEAWRGVPVQVANLKEAFDAKHTGAPTKGDYASLSQRLAKLEAMAPTLHIPTPSTAGDCNGNGPSHDYDAKRSECPGCVASNAVEAAKEAVIEAVRRVMDEGAAVRHVWDAAGDLKAAKAAR